MSQFKFGVLIVIVLWVSACSEPVDNPKCSLNSDCQSGRLCNPEGACIKAEAVTIRPVVLADVLLGEVGYSQALRAEDGIPPYEWSMTTSEAKLGWLEIDAETGELRAKAGQAPAETGRDLRVDVTVRDRSDGGVGDTAARPFGLSVIECRAPVACYEEEGVKCLEGIMECVGGVLSEDCESKQPSTDVNHCGPGCGTCQPAGDRCEAGECRCGSRDPCEAGETCCGTGCYDLSSDTAHCGECGVDCEDLTGHAAGAYCDQGECDYVACETGYHDCDGSRQNGCETLSDRSNCSACGDDCANASLYPHAVDQSCVDGECDYTCEDGYADCDEQMAGCETQLGTELNCGTCGEECTSPATPTCITTTGGETRCGCTTDPDCAADRMCCETQTCVIHSPNNCESCGHICTIIDGGLECLGDADTGWSCGCVDTANDTDCKGAYSFSDANCRSDIEQCTCLGDTNCAGIVEDMCCSTAGVPGCVDLNTDPSNCGVCGRICDSGSCDGGACTCGSCPNLNLSDETEEGWFCNSGTCVCVDIDGTAGPEPCFPGQYCCQIKGCCIKECGVAVEAVDCSDGCLTDGDVWCRWGCCSDCVDETECGHYEPEGFPFYQVP